MNRFIIAKMLITFLVLIFVALPDATKLWVIFCLFLCIIFALHIPVKDRYTLFTLIPFAITIAVLQVISGVLSHDVNTLHIIETSLKIIFTGCVVISARFFIGHEALKLLASRAPLSAGLFFLVFARTLYVFLKLNKMIFFQLQSRLKLRSVEKFYIPKYYTTALLFNQFNAMHRYHTGIISRSIDKIAEVEIREEATPKERATIFAAIIIMALYIITGS